MLIIQNCGREYKMAIDFNKFDDDEIIDVSKEVGQVWSIANTLRGTYQSDKYKNVIIPMVIIRRLECALESTKDEVIATYEEDKKTPKDILESISGYSFYNTSKYSLKALLSEDGDLKANFINYLDGFSKNIRNIIYDNLEFKSEIDKLNKSGRLLGIIKKFSEWDLHDIDTVKMGYIFEDIIRRFSENAEAGDHYTPREVIRLMTRLLLAEGCDDLDQNKKEVPILDMACGTGGMLSTSYSYLKKANPNLQVRLYGQEINPESYAMCLADMLIKGQDEKNIIGGIQTADTNEEEKNLVKDPGDTLKHDCFPEQQMRFVIINPPFGTPWAGKDAKEGQEEAVRDEFKKGEKGRFFAGLPGTGDSQLLFMQHAVYKMSKENGRAAIISNGSPLFAGGTKSGESQVRRWLLEHDYVDAIVALPTDLFYNTNIGIYVFILSCPAIKRAERKGKVQLINAVDFYKPLKKSLGKKRREVDLASRNTITKLYTDFDKADPKYSKIYDVNEFLYKEYSVYQPLQRNYTITEERIQLLRDKGKLNNFFNEDEYNELKNSDTTEKKELKKIETYAAHKEAFYKIYEILEAKAKSDGAKAELYKNKSDFMKILRPLFEDLPGKYTSAQKNSLLENIADGLSVMDKSAVIQCQNKKDPLHKNEAHTETYIKEHSLLCDKEGTPLPDTETSDSEIIKLNIDVEEYFEKEVYPHVPDAMYFDNIGTGAEFPFTRYFYEYQKNESADDLLKQFMALEAQLTKQVQEL